ncbi:META domain-containing protein [Phyllobacterium salinisoli]|uniref:META domain-containing protein n=1 Tax=Phyllobacterium salinisoli TaxID=1899321 RepID=A0A368K3G5_9HYPH|nr:META domain-containing protein [Phyllobacterium salinisoli]RCS23155.1 META domain-containing protein [Phyllobacterium salinisoli]
MQRIRSGWISIMGAAMAGTGLLAGFALLVTASLPTSGVAAEKTIFGNVVYQAKVALPPEANLHVQLADVSVADAAAKILAEARVSPIGAESSIPFSLDFASEDILPGHRYVLQARIAAGDTLWFVNDQEYSVDPQRLQQPVNINVVVVRKDADTAQEYPIENSTWLVEDIYGAGVVDNAQTTLTIGDDGEVSGSSGCNRYFTKASVAADTLSFAEVGSTYMQCPPALMNQESKFFDALGKTQSYRLDLGKLLLLDGEGKEILRFTQNG